MNNFVWLFERHWSTNHFSIPSVSSGIITVTEFQIVPYKSKHLGQALWILVN